MPASSKVLSTRLIAHLGSCFGSSGTGLFSRNIHRSTTRRKLCSFSYARMKRSIW